jgi:hypothetical protein
MPAGFTKNLLEDFAGQMKLYKEFLKIDKKKNTENPKETAAETAALEQIKIGMANCAKDIFVPPFMYLQKEGYTVTPMVRLDSLKTYNGSMNLICIWADNTVSAETIMQCAAITRVSDQPKQNAKPSDTAPVLVFIDEKSAALAEREELKNISFISKSFDLRQLDANIPGIIEASVVRLVRQNDVAIKKAPVACLDASARLSTSTPPTE